MKCYLILSLLAFAVPLLHGKPGKLPSSWKTCRKSDPQLQQCFKQAIEGAVLSLIRNGGEPSLGLLAMDPLRLTKLGISQGTGPVSIDLEFRELDMKGLKNLEITGAHIDPKTYDMRADVTIHSPLVLEGDYSVKGRVLVLPISGNGRCNLTLEEPTLSLFQKGKEVRRGGEMYLEPTDFGFLLNTRKLHMTLENLFNGNKQLGDTMNIFLNDNSDEVLKELKPAISDGFGEAFRQLSNRVFSKVPVDKIFLDK